jgi:hypothetical protein
MEYFLGSAITLAVFFIASKVFKSRAKPAKKLNVLYSQSYSHELLKFILPTNGELSAAYVETQSKKHHQKTTMRVLMLKDKAYWIKNNVFYEAEIVDGEILTETASQVDTMGMDKVQLEEIIFIVDQLTGGSEDDSGYPGKSKF